MRISCIALLFVLMIPACQATKHSQLEADQTAPAPVPTPNPPAANATDLWTCTGTPQQSLKFSIRPWVLDRFRGYFSGSLSLTYNCDKATAAGGMDGTLGAFMWKCRAVSGQVGAANITVSGIKLPNGTLAAHVHRVAENTDIMLPCVDRQATPPATAPTFASVKDIIATKCASCHTAGNQSPALSTLPEIKANRALMQQMIESGKMPYSQPTWRTTDQGKKVIEWLKFGAEFQSQP
ncbi:hypothetical protein E3A20_22020 [Planctomyces bekefii]|uniref:Cytochrome c domain-containing protein n=1 Tax=Planctomyces bekefii TaxID=1653850 RepID=A0A5C6M3J0_9PLAN|nr:hypothetical protein E3A20_22020 [Planctomyces bekefii]